MAAFFFHMIQKWMTVLGVPEQLSVACSVQEMRPLIRIGSVYT